MQPELDSPIHSRQIKGTQKWHMLYFVLAGFDVLTVCVSLGLNHNLMGMYTHSLAVSQVWAERLATYSELTQTATACNAPGNDVFESGDVDETSTRLDEKLAVFAEELAQARRDLSDNLTDAVASPLLAALDEAEAAMERQATEAHRIFAHFRSNDRKKAGARMAKMDHEYYGVTESLGSITRKVQAIQTAEFEVQTSAAASMQRVEYLIAGLIVLMVIFVAVYGHRLSIRVRETNLTLEALAKEAEEKTQLAEQRYKELRIASQTAEDLRMSLDEHAILSITDIRGDIIYANDKFCGISGYAREELIGNNYRMVKSDEHTPEFYRNLWLTISSGQVWHGELKNRAKDGSFYWVDATIVPFRDDAGKISQYIALWTDISEVKFAEKHLEQANLEIEVRNEELEAQRDETEAQRSELEEVNMYLEAQRDETEVQRQELEEINTVMVEALDREKRSAMKLETTMEQLEGAKQIAEKASVELGQRLEEVEVFNRLAIGRELRMIELKEELNALLADHGKPPKYKIAQEEVPA